MPSKSQREKDWERRPLNRLESIKERLKQNEGQFHKDKIALDADVEYLLQRLERYEKALKDITTEISYTTITPSEKVQEIEYIVEEALKDVHT